MVTSSIFNTTKKQIAILLDPEKCQDLVQLDLLIDKIRISNVDYIFVGGSTVTAEEFETTVYYLKGKLTQPIIIFPGSSHQISEHADGILLLNLISGRNSDFLIGHHVQAAQTLIDSKLSILSTSYLLIDGGNRSTVAYVSQTTPIPQHQLTIAYNTALAGKLIGHQALFLDAGSGALNSVSVDMVKKLKTLNQLLIVGGGIRTITQIEDLHQAGADIVVIGNKIEEDMDFLLDIHSYSTNKNN